MARPTPRRRPETDPTSLARQPKAALAPDAAPPAPTQPDERARLCALTGPLALRRQGRVSFALDASFFSLPLYFALKERHGYALDNAQAFVASLAPLAREAAAGFDRVVFPQSRFGFARALAEATGVRASELQKRSKADVCARALASAKWSRAERESQARAWAQMGESFSIHPIKSNQRARYVPHLFEPLAIGERERVLLIDDFVMSGGTVAAMEAALGRSGCDVFGAFFQTDSPAFRPSPADASADSGFGAKNEPAAALSLAPTPAANANLPRAPGS
jgi:hypothetical protein